MYALFDHDVAREIAFAEMYDKELARIAAALFCDAELNEQADEAQAYLRGKAWLSFADLVGPLRSCPFKFRKFDGRTELSVQVLQERLEEFLVALIGPLARAVVASRSEDFTELREELGENLGIFGLAVQPLGTADVDGQHAAEVIDRQELDHDAFTVSYRSACMRALEMVAVGRVSSFALNVVTGRMMELAALVAPTTSGSPDDARNDRVRKAKRRARLG